jgi:hypothetical protein
MSPRRVLHVDHDILLITAAVKLPTDIRFELVKVSLSKCRQSNHGRGPRVLFRWLHRSETGGQ